MKTPGPSPEQPPPLAGAAEDQALVMSTGIIGNYLPVEKIAAGIESAKSRLGDDEASVLAAAEGMMTTDTVRKLAGRTVAAGASEIRILGMAKGAAMIGPNMATMLALVITDAALTPEAAQSALVEAVADSFNCISVDGHMSTNDTVLLLASGAAGGTPLAGEALSVFSAALKDVCVELARAIPTDGEGAEHLVTIDVEGVPTARPRIKLPRPSPKARSSKRQSPEPIPTGGGSSPRPGMRASPSTRRASTCS